MSVTQLPATDKFATGLAAVYERLFAPLKDRPVALLEIGVFQGGSLFFWADFFEHERASFVGVDLVLPACSYPDRVSVHACDQNDPRVLRRIAAEHGPFDIIIDDGAHQARETRTCFDVLFRDHLKVDGTYVIEDWAVGYWAKTRRQFAGMTELVTGIMATAPERSIEQFEVVLRPGQSYAAFRKGSRGWEQ